MRISNTLFAGQGRESGVSPSGGGVGYKSCDAFVQPAFFVAGNCARNGVANVVAFRNLFSSILSIKISDRGAQFLVNCFEKNCYGYKQ